MCTARYSHSYSGKEDNISCSNEDLFDIDRSIAFYIIRKPIMKIKENVQKPKKKIRVVKYHYCKAYLRKENNFKQLY